MTKDQAYKKIELIMEAACLILSDKDYEQLIKEVETLVEASLDALKDDKKRKGSQ